MLLRSLRSVANMVLPATLTSVPDPNTNSFDCRALSTLLPGKVFFPGSFNYTSSVSSYFAAFENELAPTCVIRPANAQDVSTIITHTRIPALSGQVQLAIRGGGHTPWAGAANIQNGITLDLQDLKGVVVDHTTKIASIGSGERWSSVYSQLAAQGLAVAGGRVSKVGVAGLITGGGLSYFSANLGFVCDNVVNYEVVLASGSVVQANLQSNHDLFIALKGGSNNFGVVTRFDLPTFTQGQMWGGAIYYSASAVPAIFQAFDDFARTSSPDKQAHLIAATSWSNGAETGVSNIYHATPVVAPPSLKPFTLIEPQIFNSLRFDSLLGFAEEQSAFSTNGARQLYFTTCFRLDVKTMLNARELWLQTVKTISDVESLSLALVFQPLTKGILAKSASLTGNSLGLTPDDGPLVIMLLNSVHKHTSDDEKVVAAVLGLIDKIDSSAAKEGKAARYRFTNYGYKTQQILEGYGQESLDNLRAVSKIYDPQGFFQKGVPGGFKLSQAS